MAIHDKNQLCFTQRMSAIPSGRPDHNFGLRKDEDNQKTQKIKRIAIELNSRSRERSLKAPTSFRNHLQQHHITQIDSQPVLLQKVEVRDQSPLTLTLHQLADPTNTETDTDLFKNIEEQIKYMDDQELNWISTKTEMLSHVTASQHSTSIRIIPRVNYKVPTPFEVNLKRIKQQLD